MQSVCGVFDNRETASRAMAELMGAGFHPGQISLVAAQEARAKLMLVYNEASENTSDSGGVRIDPFAALLNEAVNVNTAAIPGMSALVAGPLAISIAGENSEASLVSALVELGVQETEAQLYEGAIRRGKALLVVTPDTDQQVVLARAVLVDSGALAAAA